MADQHKDLAWRIGGPQGSGVDTAAVGKVFAGRTHVIDMNLQAVELTYDFVRAHWPTQDVRFRLVPVETHERRLLVNGNQAVALGKLAVLLENRTHSTFEQRIAERLPSYRNGPPAHRIIADERGRPTTDLSTIFAELAITSATPALPGGAASTPPAPRQESMIRREAKNV